MHTYIYSFNLIADKTVLFTLNFRLHITIRIHICTYLWAVRHCRYVHIILHIYLCTHVWFVYSLLCAQCTQSCIICTNYFGIHNYQPQFLAHQTVSLLRYIHPTQCTTVIQTAIIMVTTKQGCSDHPPHPPFLA